MNLYPDIDPEYLLGISVVFPINMLEQASYSVIGIVVIQHTYFSIFRSEQIGFNLIIAQTPRRTGHQASDNKEGF